MLAVRDGWDTPSAFDDLDQQDSFEVGSKAEEGSISEWKRFVPVSQHVYHGKGYCSLHLYLANKETGEVAELYFNNVKKGKKHYSVKHQSKFAKLYICCFGEINKQRFSKAEQLLKHFVTQEIPLLCRTVIDTGDNGRIYNKVLDVKTGKESETYRKLNGNKLEKNWKSVTPSSPENKRGLAEFEVIKNKAIMNGVIANYQPQVISSNSNKYMVENNMNGYDFTQQPNETKEQLFDRAISETF